MSPNEIELLAEALADRVAARLSGVEKSLDVYGVAEMLGCSVPTVERLVSNGAIESFRVGRLRRFHAADVLASLKRKGGCDE